MQRPAPLLFCMALVAWTASARATERTPAEIPTPEPRPAVVDMGPNRLLLATGAATFAFAYGSALWVGATSSRSSDRPLLVPFAGPWLALGAHGACGGEGGMPCGQETTYAALLVADGLMQAASAVQIALAFLHRESRETDKPIVRSARVSFAPSRPPGGGVALAAVGQF